ncbi:hypothetical protein PT974_01053 [Cladobotryum mycophilum]|uniref:Required for respiratory growth protein 7, mitochondrial n=1 Tax=Cladobotryum mycophilum TaxID=491253 RepID=A0ABR0T411_9HYPO
MPGMRNIGPCRLGHLKALFCRNSSLLRRYSSGSHDGENTDHESLIYPDAPSKHHSDLSTFLAYAERIDLDKESNVYRGTHYEYTVAEKLVRYGFNLKRIGRSGDYGIDLIGTWTLPLKVPLKPPSPAARPMRVLIQCKSMGVKMGPRYIRELEGAFVGAPAGWIGSGVLGLMAGTSSATKGTREALGRSNKPMGYLVCSEDGILEQMLWNQRAEEEGLEGVGVAMKRFENSRKQEVVLTHNGVPLPFIGN